MIWHLLRYWTSLLIPTFYKRIEGHGIEHLQTPDPVIIAMNHPNAFTDPVAFSYVSYPLRLYYMARGDAFKPGLAAWLLEKIGIVPIFRIQDAGKEGLKRNDEAYRRVNKLLSLNNKVIVFAEGLCVQERRLRPLKKGVARMVFGAYEHLQHDRLKVIPVGVNYSLPHKFRSKLLYNVGEPMLVKDYIAQYKNNPARTMNLFLQDLERRMLDLVVHIPEPSMDETVHFTEKVFRRELMQQQHLKPSLHSEHVVSRQIVQNLVKIKNDDPALYQTYGKLAREYFEALRNNNLKDWLFVPRRSHRNTAFRLFARVLLLIVLLPVYAFGMLVNFPPLAITHLITSRIVKIVEFYSSFAFGVGMFVFLFNYVAWYFIAHAFTDSAPGAFLVLLLGGLSGMACLHIHPYLLRTLGLSRFLWLRGKMNVLKDKRRELVRILNIIFPA